MYSEEDYESEYGHEGEVDQDAFGVYHNPEEATDPLFVIIPKVVDDTDYTDVELELIHEEQQDDNAEMRHRFFTDQLDNLERPKWPANKWWFSAAAIIAFMVDMSNISAFANNVSSQGGTVFIFAYLVVLIFFAYPMLYLELILGQYFATGMIGIWGISPIGRGVGMGLFYLNCMIISILPPNILWGVLFTVDAASSITDTLVWVKCDQDWNTCNCSMKRNPECVGLMKDDKNVTWNSPTIEYFIGKILQMWKTKYADPFSITDIIKNGNWSTAYGFNNEKEGLGPLVTSSCFVMFGIYMLILILNMVNLKYLGHFYTFTTAFSLVVLAILICRVVTLDGALTGLNKYIKSDYSKLLDISMWIIAFESAFFSIGSGLGCVIAQSSFNPLNHNIRRDVIVCIAADTLTSLLSCIVAFLLIGHLYKIQHTPLPDEFPGANFAFNALAEAVSTISISGSGFFAVFLYIMIVFICLDTQVVALHSLSFSIFEEYKRTYPMHSVSRNLFMFSIWGFALCVSLMCSTRGGYWIFMYLRESAFGFNSFIFMFVESFLFSWIYGIDELCSAHVAIRGHRPEIFLRVCWKYLLPILLLTFLVYHYSVVVYRPITVFGHRASEASARITSIFQYFPMAIVGLYVIHIFYKTRGKNRTCLQVIMLLISPEYEHEKILADVKSSKRLTWRHYTFIIYDDEIGQIKEFFQNLFKWKKAVKKEPIENATEVVMEEDVRKKENKHKKKKDGERRRERMHEREESTAWDLWGQLIEEDEEATREEEAKETKMQGSIRDVQDKTLLFPNSNRRTSNLSQDYNYSKKDPHDSDNDDDKRINKPQKTLLNKGHKPRKGKVRPFRQS